MFNAKLACKILGIQLLLFALSLLFPLCVSILYQDGALLGHALSFCISFAVGACLTYFFNREKGTITPRSSFVLVASFWISLGVIGSLPFYIGSESYTLGFVDALFESFSGITTTGATVITDLSVVPQSLLFYRHQLQWFGGMGIVVLSVSILPMLGIGGMHLYKSEMPGSFKTNRYMPKIAETAKILWFIYLLLTLLCAVAYYVAGMSLFDAICHSFSTVSLGGFSTRNESLGAFDNIAIEIIAMCFMLVCALNFALHFVAWREKSLHIYWRNSECRFFLYLLICGIVLIVFLLIVSLQYDAHYALRYGLFQTISLATTAGFTTTQFGAWGQSIPYLLLIACFIGGCIGSTCGGLKAFRLLMVLKQSYLEVKRLLSPQGVFFITVDKQKQDYRLLQSIWGFFSIYVIVFVVCMSFMLATGIDVVTAFSTVAATLNNLGPALGVAENTYFPLDSMHKLLLSFVMVMGRLEIFTLLVILTSAFWRF